MRDRRRSLGPKRPRGSDSEARAQRVARAVDEPLDVRFLPGGFCLTLEVLNPAHQTHYTVYLPAHPAPEGALCTCEDFARRGIGTCKHIEAVRLFLVDHPPAPSSPAAASESAAMWARVDEREAAMRADRRPDALRWRAPGSVLFQPVEGPHSKPATAD